jgi:hypothetical protein
MDAPLYPPATAYEQPVRMPRALSTKDTAINDLMAIPAAWAIVAKEIPNVHQRISSDQMKPHLGNFAFRDLIQFGVFKAADLDRIDPQLKALGAVQ